MFLKLEKDWILWRRGVEGYRTQEPQTLVLFLLTTFIAVRACFAPAPPQGHHITAGLTEAAHRVPAPLTLESSEDPRCHR